MSPQAVSMERLAAASADWWQAVLSQEYGIEAQLVPLQGYRDLNFAVVEGGARTHVLKVMHPECEPSLVDMQIQALDHIARFRSELPVPRVTHTSNGEPSVAVEDSEGRQRLVWLITLMPGRHYADVRPQSLGLVRNLGSTLAELDRVLLNFDHPALGRESKWDLRRSGWVHSSLECIEEPDRRKLLARVTKALDQDLLTRLDPLPASPIHNDANDYNIFVDQARSAQLRISGIIDFGDMIKAPVVCELAIAGAYAVLGQKRPIAALAALVAGYNSISPLSDDELALVWPLVLTRLAVSVTNSAMNKREKPDDPYATISEQPAWDFLGKSEQFSADRVLASLRTACGSHGHVDAGQKNLHRP